MQNDPEFQALDVQLLSIAFDPASDQTPAMLELGISEPMLIDEDHSVSEMYDVLQWAVGTGEPGHTFILVDGDGTIAWIQDYGAPSNPNATMYVPVLDLNAQMAAALGG